MPSSSSSCSLSSHQLRLYFDQFNIIKSIVSITSTNLITNLITNISISSSISISIRSKPQSLSWSKSWILDKGLEISSALQIEKTTIVNIKSYCAQQYHSMNKSIVQGTAEKYKNVTPFYVKKWCP